MASFQKVQHLKGKVVGVKNILKVSRVSIVNESRRAQEVASMVVNKRDPLTIYCPPTPPPALQIVPSPSSR